MFRLTRTKRLFSGIALAGCLITAFAFYRHVRQIRLDHKLIRALRHLDSASALNALANGADANARELPETSPSFLQVLKSVFVHRPPTTTANARPALFVAVDWRWQDVAHEGEFWLDNYTPANAPPQDPRVIAELLEHGADAQVVNECDLTPLQVSAWEGKAETVRLLIRHGAKVNVHRIGEDFTACKSTPLMLAIANGDIATVRTLAMHGADINEIRDELGDTALTFAKCRKDEAIVAILEAALNKSKKTP